ncbi:ABC transporter G family member 40 isoform X1 [Oryza glaberrima]|uniref:ABC transporter G family member 40 isoform X1 n=1 Tax=Oryza glaberrima TaxID=4538 RepID=UPI00224C1F3E|nr:ABC transporter G family member 40 isoform X1 [Oryza glaberrima]
MSHRHHAALVASASGRSPSWGSAISQSFRQVEAEDPFRRAQSMRGHDEEEDLRWAALEKLPTYDRMRRGVVRSALLRDGDDDHKDDDDAGTGKAVELVDIGRLATGDAARALVERLLQDDSERFLRRLRDRIDMVGIELPKIEIRYEELSVQADAFVASRALPTLSNSAINFLQGLIGQFGSSNKKTINILKQVNGILKSSRMTLLLGPPSSGKSTLMRALTGKLDKNLKVFGNITYCGHKFSEFYPERTSAYVSQYDLHNAEMTVRETLDFSRWCLGIGSRYDMLTEISRRERNAGIKPDPEIDAFMKATAMQGQETNIITDLILKVLGLDICADTIVGDEMIRGISGGQMKRVTTGEMLTGPARALLMDEISTGLDSSSTFHIVKFIRHLVHIMNETVMISLLQPPPETYNLFDDIVLLSEGYIVYHGPRENILEFFEASGFRCPQRKAVADFLQEVTSKKDQQQYWFLDKEPYRYVSVAEFAERFKSFYIGQQMMKEQHIPFEKSKIHPAALTTMKNALSNWESLKAVLCREKLLMKRNSFLYIFKVTQLIILAFLSMTVFLRTKMPHGQFSDGTKFLGALTFNLITVMFNGLSELNLTVKKLPVFYKHRDFLFFPPWTFGVANILIKVPVSLVEATVWVVITYYVMGFAPAGGRFFRQFLAFFITHLMAMALFRFLGAILQTMVIAISFGMLVLLIVFVFGGFVIRKNDIRPWWIWCYWASPMMYSQNAISINEFLASRWAIPNNDTTIDAKTVGEAILKSKGLFTGEWGFWLSIGALVGFIILFNTLYILALTYLSPIRSANALVIDEHNETALYTETRNEEHRSRTSTTTSSIPTTGANGEGNRPTQSQFVLPFQPLSLCFNHLNYYVDMPSEMKQQGLMESRLQLLSDISGAFRPGLLTALVGVSGAGKTTLMDVLAGRKTSGTIEGSITLSGYSKKQETFARISGYCEQADIHSPNVTVYESILYSAWLRLPSDVDSNTRKMFVEEVMALVELDVLCNAMVGLPGVSGLSTEQRKRLTIAVELVANPSIIFMDEPTSGLDARAAAIVMRTVRNTVNTGRTVVCTIHQPSIDIFESFDELLLLKRGGRVIYAGELGDHSHKLVEYFETISGVPSITEGYNPATWMLEVSSTLEEARMNVDFAEIYANSLLYRKNQELIEELSIPPPGYRDLLFATKYSQSFYIQCVANLWKQYKSYWKNPSYNSLRYLTTFLYGLFFGTVFWQKGTKLDSQQDLYNLLGATYAAIFFIGATNCMSVQPVVSIERAVYYRESAAGMYSPLSYAFAQASVEFIYNIIQGILYTVIIYAMIGYDWKASKFFYFLFFIVSSFNYFTFFGMMLVACTPSALLANILITFALPLWNLFAGFLIFRKAIPIWWRWYYWANPVSWTIYGVIASQFGGNGGSVSVPGGIHVAMSQILEDNVGVRHDFLGYVILAHFGFMAAFVLIFGYSIKFLNFQKR